jgi:hypothetical protein
MTMMTKNEKKVDVEIDDNENIKLNLFLIF